MNTLKFYLEYRCYPIWHYDENGNLIDNDLPDELRGDIELDELLLKTQDLFDSLYSDTPKVFSSHGFKTDNDRQAFLSLLFSSVDLLKKKYGKNYIIECSYTQNSFLFNPTN